jgi:hypothetical protein
MLRTFRWIALVLAFSVGLSYAADEPKKEPADPPKKETKETPKEAPKVDAPKIERKTEDLIMQFHDGTSIRLVPLDKQLEIVTKYGKLTVPSTDIRRIEFGLHMPEDIAKQVDDIMKDLESTDFQTREAAGKKLVSLGRYAYPTMVKASKGSNLETTRRIQELLKDLRKKYPAYQLKIRTEDMIYTKDFTIVGNLVSPTIKVKTEHFGEATVKLSDLRSARTTSGSGEVEVAIDASKYGSNINQWMETEFTVESDVRLKITASGTVDTYAQAAGQYLSGPEGNNQLGQRGRYIPGQLLGRIGETGQVFVIGPNYDGTPQQEGKLYLHIWPFQGGGGATGSYTVKISSGN